MPYDIKAIAKTREIFDKKRSRLTDTIQRRREELCRLDSRFEEIERRLSMTGIRLVKAVMDKTENIEDIKRFNQNLQIERTELLVLHGYPLDYLDVKYDCNICNDEGFTDDKMCECFKKELHNQEYINSNMGAALADCTFKNFNLKYYSDEPMGSYAETPYKNMQEILKRAKQFARGEKPASLSIGLLLVGATGLGKTFLSAAIAHEQIERGNHVIYQTALNLSQIVVGEFFKNSYDNDSSQTVSFNTCDLLIIDDLGAEINSQYSATAIYNIINTRTLNQKRMVISTNKTMTELQDMYGSHGPRITSRLIGDFTMFKFYGHDIRQQKLKIR